MTFPINLLVRGTPVSFQSRGRALLEWKRKLASVARSRVERPTGDDGLAVSITHYYRMPPRCDADNMSKPICDALSNIVYRNDRQIGECVVRRVPISQPFVLWGMPRELAIALCEGNEFVYIRVRKVRSESLLSFRAQAALLWAS